MRRLLIGLLLLAVFILPASAEQSLEIIKLRNRSAEQILPQITPFVEAGGAVSGTGYQIFLRASVKNRGEIQDLITSLDQPLRRLMITVKQDRDWSGSETGGAISGSITSGNARIIQQRNVMPPGTTVDIRRGDNVVRGRSYGTRGSTSDNVSQQLQVLEGGKAYIQIGQSIALPLHQVVLTPNGAIVSDSIVYRDIGTGFYAAPAIAGNRVTLEISPTHDTVNYTGSRDINLQRLSTTVSGQLGEWIELSGMQDNQSEDNKSATSYSTRTGQGDRRIWLRVEELP